MTRPGTPNDHDPDATRLGRPASPPPGSDATQLEPPFSRPPGSDATQLEPPPARRPASDATQLEQPLSRPPGYDATPFERPPAAPSAYDATQLERPPAYPAINAPPPGPPPGRPPGYDATQLERPPVTPSGSPPAQGYPPGSLRYGEPFPTTQEGIPPGAPAFPPGSAAQPAQPSGGSRRGLVIGGILLALVVIVAGAVLFVLRNRTDSGDALSTQRAADQAVGATAAANATRAAGPALASTTPSVAAGGTVVPPAQASGQTAPTAPALVGPTDTWTDPENRITVRYPADWKRATFDTRDENQTLAKSQSLVDLTGPDSVRFSVAVYVSTKTLDGDVQEFKDLIASDAKIAFTPDQTRDQIVGGEPAKLLTGSYTQNGKTSMLAVWFVDHGGKRFGLSADQIGTHRNDVDAIIGAVAFVPVGQQVTVTPGRTSTATTGTRAPTGLPTTSSIFGTPAATRRTP